MACETLHNALTPNNSKNKSRVKLARCKKKKKGFPFFRQKEYVEGLRCLKQPKENSRKEY